jgi:hypothetical protein
VLIDHARAKRKPRVNAFMTRASIEKSRSIEPALEPRYIDNDFGRGFSRPRVLRGAIAQLGERLNGIQEVRGSTPLGSTNSLTNVAAALNCRK